MPILVTPFQSDESLDLESLHRIVEFMARIGVQGVTVLGVLGEADRLSERERAQVIVAAVKASAGRLPVIVGISHTGTEAAIELGTAAEALGAQGLLVAPLKDAGADESRIVEFYRRLAERCKLPICIQDYPPASGVALPVPLLLRLIEEIPGVVAVKVEAVPSPAKIAALTCGMTIRQATLLGGLGALYSYYELQSGAGGFMTGFAFPEILLALLQAFEAGNQERAYHIYRQYLPMIVFEQQPGVAIRKEIYRLRGLITSNRVRHPGATLAEDAARQLQEVLPRVFGGCDLTCRVSIP